MVVKIGVEHAEDSNELRDGVMQGIFTEEVIVTLHEGVEGVIGVALGGHELDKRGAEVDHIRMKVDVSACGLQIGSDDTGEGSDDICIDDTQLAMTAMDEDEGVCTGGRTGLTGGKWDMKLGNLLILKWILVIGCVGGGGGGGSFRGCWRGGLIGMVGTTKDGSNLAGDVRVETRGGIEGEVLVVATTLVMVMSEGVGGGEGGVAEKHWPEDGTKVGGDTGGCCTTELWFVSSGVCVEEGLEGGVVGIGGRGGVCRKGCCLCLC